MANVMRRKNFDLRTAAQQSGSHAFSSRTSQSQVMSMKTIEAQKTAT